MMNPQRFAALTAVALTGVLAGWVVAWLAGLGSAGIESTGAAPVVENRPASLAADAEFADALRATAMSRAAAESTDKSTAAGSVANTSAASNEPKSIAEVPLTDSSQMQQPDTQPLQVATASMPNSAPNDATKALSSIDIPDECGAADNCIDRYLWSLYERTPKEDTIKVHERRKVTVKKKGKKVTVSKTFIKLVDEDFTWKDPKAAERAGMPMMAYVIGGMDRSFKLKLFRALHAADEAGLSPGITSAFRDDYRQSIAKGLTAAVNRSYHGGSFRGGYGHGLAADVVSVKGETRDQRWNASENLWKWIDAHGEEFGIGRPYLDKDPPHVAPIDGQEYASHHRRTKAQHAGSDTKKRG